VNWGLRCIAAAGGALFPLPLLAQGIKVGGAAGGASHSWLDIGIVILFAGGAAYAVCHSLRRQ
jgi:hypothetical protein